MIYSTFKNKRVLVTGNTGFKGSWLVAWLSRIGAQVSGLSDGVPTNPSIFRAANQAEEIQYFNKDIRLISDIQTSIHKARPEFIFHFAAQSLVRKSYSDPLDTIMTNALGTCNVLESLRTINWPCTSVFITSDKVYDNVEWSWGYREIDTLGGKDPYSASKAMAELAINTYTKSYFDSKDSNVRIAIGRAGNVIGGGDWALDRIVPDAVRAWFESKELEIRNPFATRPWQHVLEPLSGYLLLAAKLATNHTLHGEAFNFGPRSEQNASVQTMIEKMQKIWPNTKVKYVQSEPSVPLEAGLLKLNCDKALHLLQWQPTLDFEQTCEFTMNWYRKYYLENKDANNLLEADIDMYENWSRKRGMDWFN